MHLHLFSFTDWLVLHTEWSYAVLFFGMFFETLIGTSFFIVGEIFLLTGPVLAGSGVLNIWYVTLALYAGALLGDNVNYALGRHLGPALFKEGRWIVNPANYEKGKAFFARFGTKAVFLARLIGPFNLVMPFLAGTYKVPYRAFLSYNTAGVLVGVGQFIVVGYFFGNYAHTFFPWLVVRPVTSAVGITAILLIFGWLIGKRMQRPSR